ncbi:hypothetical protein ACFODZ_13115 [Marinicella sediminis]|uniref:DUF4345 domain-containing protein n=1 Tax=Marinicella sediminis TaxID=1792834 RepID=A0ABV7JGF3_9GAMM|nr:hypothetical protein [Marinicella sediminis]
MKKILKYSALYFAIVFTIGFVLGTIRVLYVAPQLGDDQAELLEFPLMVLASFVVARYIVGLAGDGLKPAQLLWVGVMALGCLLMVEFSLVLALREMSIVTYVTSRYSLAGAAYLVSLLLFAVFPFVISIWGKPNK